MSNKRCLLVAVLMTSFCILAHANASSVLLKQGATGDAVWELQLSLFQRGFLHMTPTGLFDATTLDAVRRFQEENGLVIDGIVGRQTWLSLQQALSSKPQQTYQVRRGDTLWSLARHYGISVEMIAKANRLRNADRVKAGQTLIIPIPESEASPSVPTPSTTDAVAVVRAARERLIPAALSWSEVQRIFPHNTVARVMDVETGKSFRVRRYYGTLHADVEPLTAEDTATMKSIYGQWSWQRRAIVVEVAGRRIAASMNGVPHGNGAINDNDFAGHFCIHFKDSRTHNTRQVCPDHQAAIQAAVRAFSSAAVTATEQSPTQD